MLAQSLAREVEAGDGGDGTAVESKSKIGSALDYVREDDEAERRAHLDGTDVADRRRTAVAGALSPVIQQELQLRRGQHLRRGRPGKLGSGRAALGECRANRREFAREDVARPLLQDAGAGSPRMTNADGIRHGPVLKRHKVKRSLIPSYFFGGENCSEAPILAASKWSRGRPDLCVVWGTARPHRIGRGRRTLLWPPELRRRDGRCCSRSSARRGGRRARQASFGTRRGSRRG